MNKSILQQLKELKANVKTAGMRKLSAEETELYELGKIFGRGMAEGYLEKIAEELSEAAEQAAQTLPQQIVEQIVEQPSEYADNPNEVPAESTDTTETEIIANIKAQLLELTPEQVVAWFEQLPDEYKQVIASDPELYGIVDAAYKQVSAPADDVPGSDF
ncbi:MAG: hypothetical protein QXE80_03335 [Pyrobaculum sp.]